MTHEANPPHMRPYGRQILICEHGDCAPPETAQRLAVSTRTVQTHRERLRAKLNIHTIAGLTRFAIENGLIARPKL